MASTNQSPFYQKAEQMYLSAGTLDEKLIYLEEMIKECPKHKSSEKMLSNLKNRYRKLKESIEKSRKSRKSKGVGIKKQDMQALIVGFPNSGKSSLFKVLTGQDVKISPYGFSTISPVLGTIGFEDVKIQIIDIPSFPNEDKGLVNSTDTLVLVVDNLKDIEKSKKFLEKSNAKVIIVFNKGDLLGSEERRKTEANLLSHKLNFVMLSCVNFEENVIYELKKKIFGSFPVIRIYTKEPGKLKSNEPMILKKQASVKNAAEKISKGMSEKVKRTRIWGPSSRFGGQVVGLEHVLKDKDVVEFQVR